MSEQGALPAPRRRFFLFLAVALLLLGAVAGGVACRKASRQAALHRETLRQGLLGVTRIRVWGAGIRTGSGFCGCAVVPKPERVFFETRDATEIRDLIDRIHPRRYLELDPQVSTCGTVTLEFLRGEEPVFWIHKMGRDLRSSKGIIPVTTDSAAGIEAWLDQREVRQSIQAAVLRQSDLK